MTDIVIEGLRKSYGDKPVLRGWSAVFPAGEVSAVMGPSGCGKTTLLRLIMGLETPDAGTISGVPARVAAVFQEDRLCPALSARANVRLATPRAVPDARIDALLAELGLPLARQSVREFSGGMRRRVAIARALCAPGELLLLDEPFRALDAARRGDVAALVRRESAGKTVLLVTHDETEAALLGAARILAL